MRVLANKLAFAAMDLEVLRNEAVQRVDTRRLAGLATVDAIRFVLSDRMPGHGVTLAAKACHLMVPRRYREEALAQIGAGAKVVLAKRYPQLAADDRHAVLGITWAAALYEDPSLARRALSGPGTIASPPTSARTGTSRDTRSRTGSPRCSRPRRIPWAPTERPSRTRRS